MNAAHRRLLCAAATALLLPACAGEAAAACTRRIVNRSALTLVGSQNGGPAFVVPPGRARSVRLVEPGTFDLAAYCSPVLAPSIAPAAQAHLTYEAILDRCYIELGTNELATTFGRGTFGMQGTWPFTANMPRQGDIVLGPVAAEACRPQ